MQNVGMPGTEQTEPEIREPCAMTPQEFNDWTAIVVECSDSGADETVFLDGKRQAAVLGAAAEIKRLKELVKDLKRKGESWK